MGRRVGGRLLVRREVRVVLLGRHGARVGRVLRRDWSGVGLVVRVLRLRLRVEAVLRRRRGLLLRLRVRHGRGRVVLGLPVHEAAGLGEKRGRALCAGDDGGGGEGKRLLHFYPLFFE